MHFLLKIGRLVIVTNDGDDTAACCHAQFREQVADKLYITIVYPVEGHGIYIVNDNVPFNHSILLMYSTHKIT